MRPPPAGWPSGPSVDQRIADVIGTTTKLRSLELGVQVGAADNWGRMCYRAANQPLPPEDDPAAVYANVFADLHTDPAVLAPLRARRKSILDTVGAQYTRVAGAAGRRRSQRLDAHLTAVREIEQRLDHAVRAADAACQDPASPAAVDHRPTTTFRPIGGRAAGSAGDGARVRHHARRVAAVVALGVADPLHLAAVADPEGHHDLSHRGDDDAAAVDKLTRINQWYATQLAALIDAS